MPNPDDEDAAARQKFEEEEQQRIVARQMYDAMFEGKFYKNVSTGRDWVYGIPTPETPTEDKQTTGIGLYGIPTGVWKPVSFSDIRKKSN
jgi:hypothetical protein